MAQGEPSDLSETLTRVLSEPRFAEAPPEGWWERMLERILTVGGRIVGAIVEALGGPRTAAIVALGLLAAVTLLVVGRLARRRATEIDERLGLARLIESGADPDFYLEEAEAASRRGDHGRAIRLRFVGEVLRMAVSDRIRYSPGLTTEGIALQIGDPVFDRLAEQFDAVAYGNAAVGLDDDKRSRSWWEEVKALA